jgi:hypothetical protein
MGPLLDGDGAGGQGGDPGDEASDSELHNLSMNVKASEENGA